MPRLQLAGHGRVLRAWLDAARTPRPGVGGRRRPVNDYALRLTPEQARALADELDAVLDRWLGRAPAAEPAEGTELVSVLLDVVPLRDGRVSAP